MKQKTRLVMRVQGPSEPAAEFAARLEKECEEIQKNNPQMMSSCVVIPTSAGDGRQTATIQWMENLEDEDDPLFSGMALSAAFEKYKEENRTDGEAEEVLIFWLRKLKKKDLKIDKNA